MYRITLVGWAPQLLVIFYLFGISSRIADIWGSIIYFFFILMKFLFLLIVLKHQMERIMYWFYLKMFFESSFQMQHLLFSFRIPSCSEGTILDINSAMNFSFMVIKCFECYWDIDFWVLWFLWENIWSVSLFNKHK